MLISKNHLRTRWTASKDTTRPLLTTIDIRTEKEEIVAVATDGYVLSQVRERTPNEDGFPNTGSATVVSTARPLATTAASIERALKKSSYIDVLNYAHVGEGGITVTNLEQTQKFVDAQVEGKYPEYEHLIPSTELAKAVVKINPAYLEKVLKVFKGQYEITLELHGALSPVVLRSEQDEVTITGVVMPLKR